MFGQRAVYNGNRPEVHDVIRHWRAIADSYDPPRVLLGETPVDDERRRWRAFYGADLDELHLAFNFPFINAPFEAEPRCATSSRRPRRCCRRARGRRGPARTTTCRGSRRAGRDDDPRRIRAALLMLLTLRGTPVLYQGDEIGLGDVAVAPHEPARPARRPLLARIRGPRRDAHADALARRARRRFHRARRRAVAPARRHHDATSTPNAPIRARC